MITNVEFAKQAGSSKYTGIPYTQLDCQAFVEKVLFDSGCKKSNGAAYNWKGSNDMWRNALSWKGTLDECLKQYGEIPVGAWVFILAYDGGEKDRGYNDNQGNAKHVGIYVGQDAVRDSTRNNRRDGVGYRELKDFNRVGFCRYLDYLTDNKENNTGDMISIINSIRAELDKLERMVLNDLRTD